MVTRNSPVKGTVELFPKIFFQYSLLMSPIKIAQKPFAIFTVEQLKKAEEKCITILCSLDLKLMGFVLSGMFPDLFGSMRFGDGVFLTVLVDRLKFGLAPGKPGDIDILVIPHRKGIPEYQSTVALEVKILRPRYATRARSTNSFGISQASGLIADGFPYVGLLTIVVPETPTGTPREKFANYNKVRMIDAFGRCEDLGPIDVDSLGIDVAERHLGRLASLATDETIALCTVAISIAETSVPLSEGPPVKSSRIIGHSIPEVRPRRGGAVDKGAVHENIAAYFTRYGGTFLDCPWFSKDEAAKANSAIREVEAHEVNILGRAVFTRRVD